jgi:ribosome biogenesis GTPase A
VLPELDEIAGDNPVILAANKADLLPSAMGQTRAENWVRRELEYMNVKSIANIGGAVRLVSCKTGFGVAAMIEKAKSLAADLDCDIYVVGAANAGKVSSSLSRT